MGLAIEREDFTPEDYRRFAQRLAESVEALRRVLQRPGFGAGPRTVGAELEMFLVDASGFPLPVNRQVLGQTVDPRVTLELDRFNLECNLRPGPLAGRPFTALRAEFEDALAEVRRAAATQGAGVVVTGILPTLREAGPGPGCADGHAALPGALGGGAASAGGRALEGGHRGRGHADALVGRRDAGRRQHLAPVPPAGDARGVRPRVQRGAARHGAGAGGVHQLAALPGAAAVGRDAGGALPAGGG